MATASEQAQKQLTTVIWPTGMPPLDEQLTVHSGTKQSVKATNK